MENMYINNPEIRQNGLGMIRIFKIFQFDANSSRIRAVTLGTSTNW